MALESSSGIWSLVIANPVSTDDVNEGDDHIRLIKSSIKQTFPGISATVNVSQTELNHLSGIDSNIRNSIDDISASYNAHIAYGSIYLSDNASEISSTSSFNTFVGFDVVGVSNLVTAGTVTGALVVTNAGHYDIIGNMSLSSSAAIVMTGLVMIDDLTSNIRSEIALAAGGTGMLHFAGVESAGADSKIQIRLAGSVTTAFTVTNAQLKVRRAD